MRTRTFKLISFSFLIPLVLALAGPMAPSKAADPTLTNGCTVNARGIPTCGAYFGAAYKANSDPSSWESSMGRNIGVRRTYWGSGSAASAANVAKADVAKNRVPWMSFKPPYSWSEMAAGKGDAWAKDLATRMKAAGGPVWVAVAHEPEGDGDMQKWKAMQARIAPIMRAAAPNLGYTVILMGYHQLYGDAKYSLANTWPNTKIDMAGFDVYEKYGVKGYTTWKDMDGAYFSKFQSWAKSKGVAWGLAETGYSDPAAKAWSGWMAQTYKDMVKYGGIAFAYFNTDLHSQANWTLNLATKQNAFTTTLKTTPSLR